MSDVLVEARGLEVRIGARALLRGIDLALREGELVALIGPNAAGKSTLLRALAGLVAPTAGRVDARAPRARTLAYLSQSETLPGTMRARDVVQLGRVPHHGLFGALGARDRVAIERAMDATRCAELADRRIAELSGGERQRVALARALAQEPRALLLDEPLTHLDVRHQRDLVRTLRGAVSGGMGVLLVLHELSLATHADRCVLLDEGRIAMEGAPGDVLTGARLGEVFGVSFEVVRTRAGTCVVPWMSEGGER